MSKFFIGFLVIFALTGVVYRLQVGKPTPILEQTVITYVDDELGFTLEYIEGAPVSIGLPIIIPSGARAQDTIASSTFLDPSGSNPKPEDFTKEITQNTTVYYIQSSRFEGTIMYDGYFVKNNFIIPIKYSWSGVDWTNPEYSSKNDPKFTEFLNILKSIKFIHTEQGIYEGIQQ